MKSKVYEKGKGYDKATCTPLKEYSIKSKMVYPLEIGANKHRPLLGFWQKFELPSTLDFQPCA
jgi:hypothetical protein